MQVQTLSSLGPIFRISVCATFAFSLLAGCATKPQAQFVNDPDAKKESSIPWNKQEKWESQGAYAGMTDRR